MIQERESLNRVLGRADVLALAFGTMIGWGWVMLAGQWVTDAGFFGAILAFLIGAVVCFFVGLVYAELTPMLPLAGGELVFSYRGLGYTLSWITGWSIALAYVGVSSWESIAISTAFDYLFGIPKAGYIWTIAKTDVYLSWCSIGMIGAIALSYLNVRGAKPSAVFQGACTIGLAIVGIVYFIGGVANVSTEFITTAFTGKAGLMAVLVMAPAMYVGFDVIPQAAEEMNIPLNAIAKVLLLSIVMAASWYILMIIATALSAPAKILTEAKVPVADAMAYNFGSPIWGKVLILGGTFGIVTSWNGFFVGGSRVIFAMGRAKMLPAVFGKVHPQYGTPYAAIYLVGALAFVSPLLGRKALVWFVDAAGAATIFAYFLVSCAFIALRKKEPDLERPYKALGGNVTGWIAIIASFLWCLIYIPGLSPAALVWPQEVAIVGLWSMIGIVLAIWGRSNYPNVGLSEREHLIYGEKYARKHIAQKNGGSIKM